MGHRWAGVWCSGIYTNLQQVLLSPPLHQGSTMKSSSVSSRDVEQQYTLNPQGTFRFTVGSARYGLDFSSMWCFLWIYLWVCSELFSFLCSYIYWSHFTLQPWPKQTASQDYKGTYAGAQNSPPAQGGKMFVRKERIFWWEMLFSLCLSRF